MLKNIVGIFSGDPTERAIKEYSSLVDEVNALEADFEKLSEDELRGKTAEFKQRLADGETLDDLLVEAFATVREVSKRTIGLRHYDVQLIGGAVLHVGQVAEMRTGEGKTLMSTLPLYLNALTGKGVHLITVNDYLARRDARWMAPIYTFLGLSVGVLQMAARTEHGKKGFLVNLEKESPHEDQHQLDMVERAECYGADITYGTNNEYGFDYLRDNMTLQISARVQREHNFAIIDEVDNVLIDEARTPLIISGPSHDDAENYMSMARTVKQLRPEHYEINEKDRNVVLTEIGEMRVEVLLGQPLRDPERPEDTTPEQVRLMGYLEQAMRAQYLFKRNKDYLVQAGQVVIIDEYTGRLMPGRRWSDGLHQAVEAKEGVKVQGENVTYATITIQNYFRMYEKLAGMTGTALTEAEEFDKIYKLEVLAIPPHVDYNATREDGPLSSYEDKDEYGYKYTYYSAREDDSKIPLFYRRKDYPDVVYRTGEAKLRALVTEIVRYHIIGRPILVGTTSVENSELLSTRLRAEMVQRLLQVQLLRYTWFEANNREEDGRMVMALSYMNEPLDKIELSAMRQQAKTLDIQLNPGHKDNLPRMLAALDLEEEHADRLVKVLQGGIPQQVLNARKHTEESQIIAGAGAFGAVTIATNMAGRGVDIKLGGEIAEEILSSVNRVLNRAGYSDPFEMSLEEREEAIKTLSTEDYGIYESEIKFFLKSMEDMRKVKELGGLHVIGSERHDARRIDNQLRGRAARQGDPGSSRFYLSMEDDLMRLFGGQQVDSMMQRMGMDDALPLESGIVDRIIEQSQTRVEGANFDARKHLLEYDDVLNQQREKIYAQRDTIFTKDDLSEDVREMIQTEVEQRVPGALEDESGPWRLLAWLEQVQPSFAVNNTFFPSFTYKLLLDYLKEQDINSNEDAKAAGLKLAENALKAEEEHILNSAGVTMANIELRYEEDLNQKYDDLNTFFDGLQYRDETDMGTAKERLDEITALVRTPIKFSNQQLQLLDEDEDEAADLISEQIDKFTQQQWMIRLVGAVDRLLRDDFELEASSLVGLEWDEIAQKVEEEIQALYANKRERLVGDGKSLIAQDLDNLFNRMDGEINDAHLLNMLIQMPQGSAISFDKKTKKRVQQRTTRLIYAYFAGQFLESMEQEDIFDKALSHLDNALTALQQVMGIGQWPQLSEVSLDNLNEKARQGIQKALGDNAGQLNGKPLGSLPNEDKARVVEELGRQTLTEIYRQLILRVISDLWIDYITQMEALRVAIGLEAYAQRDPLVQYKAQAFQMFQQLFEDMRAMVVNRMFTFQPQQAQAQTQMQQEQAEPQIEASSNRQEEEPVGEAVQAGSQGGGAVQSTGGKRKRRRRRKKKKK
ncbi:MAG: hypothetical protein DWQ07_16125 [Chloroflexi bacterium]|nr:MAG: hypothetical protein DWQ07_16125 [Chloroflexota bacterium]MBL1195279.1 hypothetical protein [Chloroflexota bacterium]NOH12563.1 hypothetical protein [Chloroflexota bacterium]